MLSGAIQTRSGRVLLPHCYLDVAASSTNTDLNLKSGCSFSDDSGSTWSFVGNIALDSAEGRPFQPETKITAVATSRPRRSFGTAGSGWRFARSTSKLWQSYSSDDGQTWSKPTTTAFDLGGTVYTCRLNSGRLILIWNAANWDGAEESGGWPRDYTRVLIAYSENDGQSWSRPFTFAWGMRAVHSLVEEVKRGQLLITMPQHPILLRISESKLLELAGPTPKPIKNGIRR